MLSLLGATVLGFAIAASGSPTLLHWADLLAPVGALWVTGIRMTVIPLVVALIVSGIAGGADENDLGKIGARVVAVFLGLLTLFAVIAVPAAPFAFRSLAWNGTPSLPTGAADAARQVSDAGGAQTFATWLPSLLPANPVAAAASGAILPLVLFTILFAIAVTRLPSVQRRMLVDVVRAVGDAMQVLVRGVIALAPIGVFALMLPLAAHAGSSFAGAIGLYIAVYSGASIAGTLLLYPIVRLLTGIPIRQFATAILPAQTIAFTSSSSIATLPSMLEAANERLALPPRAGSFVLPLAVSTFKISAPVAWSIGTAFIAWFYGVPLSASALGIIALSAVFLAFAAPGVPNGAFLLLTPLFVQVGLPAEGVGVLIALDAIPDRFVTVFNVTGDIAAAAIATRRRTDSVRSNA